MSSRTLVGTASWADKALVESGWYPQGMSSAEERLRYYASQFPLVEVDSSYYAMPSVHNAALWAERTPDGFVFDVKAFRLFTRHQTPMDALPADIRQALPPQPGQKKNVYYQEVPAELRDELWRRFQEALLPLATTGKLGVVLFQFPPWFYPSRENAAHILECAERLGGFRLAVEFRRGSWVEGPRQERTLALLRENGLAYVAVDEPQGFGSSVPTVAAVTSPEVAILRLHGRNAQTWEMKGLASSAQRFNYLYSEEELRGLVPTVRRLADEAQQVHVVFNNCYHNYAPTNARQMAELLQQTIG
ncbi:MAG: DUF72 domain-containing protein [Dehalococcoidia bacterium]